MKEKIIEELKKIEKKENIKILCAVESGSRAWGFAGTDSDYDVRFIYARDKNFYLKLEDTRDVIEYPINELLDITGWDISKALKLAHNSNPSLFEWLESPIVYKDECIDELKKLFKNYFSIKKISSHYYHMAEHQDLAYLKNKENVNVKKYFYLLRAILSAKYVLDNKKVPPIEFNKLRMSLVPKNINKIINQLIEIKLNSTESSIITKNKELDLYIENLFEEVKQKISNLPKEEEKSWKALNDEFIKIISMTELDIC